MLIMNIQPRYLSLAARLDMVRGKMPQIAHENAVRTMAVLRETTGEKLHNCFGEVGALLAGFKPAVSFCLPRSTAVAGIERELSGLGFRFASQEETVQTHQGPLPIRSGIIWGVAPVCEMYGRDEAALQGWIEEISKAQNAGKLPGHLLGYADNELDTTAWRVSVWLEPAGYPNSCLRVHFSRARDISDADTLAAYYRQSAAMVKGFLDLHGPVISEVSRPGYNPRFRTISAGD